jgi:hypothetical protein
MEAATQTQSIQQSIPPQPEAEEFGVHQIGVAPTLASQTEVENRAVEFFIVFVAAEVNRHDAGMAFGQSVLDLREEIKSSGDRNFMERLKELGISYEKARYWMAKVEGKRTNRHKEEQEPADEEEPIFGWDSALQKLEALSDDVEMLIKSELVGSDVLVKPLRQLGDLLGCLILFKGGKNERLLQRKRPDGSSVAEGADEGRTDSTGGGR